MAWLPLADRLNFPEHLRSAGLIKFDRGVHASDGFKKVKPLTPRFPPVVIGWSKDTPTKLRSQAVNFRDPGSCKSLIEYDKSVRSCSIRIGSGDREFLAL